MWETGNCEKELWGRTEYLAETKFYKRQDVEENSTVEENRLVRDHEEPRTVEESGDTVGKRNGRELGYGEYGEL